MSCVTSMRSVVAVCPGKLTWIFIKNTQNNWAVTCDFQQCGILTSVYSDESVYPPFKLRDSK